MIFEGFFNGPTKIDQVLRKRLTNGSIITLGYAARSADRMRGRSILSGDTAKYGDNDTRPRGGLLGFDEIQDVIPEVIPVLKEMAFRTKNPRFLYAGTPKSMANPIEGIRRRSTGFEWAVRCEGCNKWNLEWTELNIGNTGVVCQYCHKPLNTYKGQWVARRHLDVHKGKDATTTIESYRIPQLIVKPIMDDPFKWIELLEKLRTYSTEKFKNEVLGLPHDSGSNPVTEAQLFACCKSDRLNEQPDPNKRSYPPLVMGVDWAFTAENSYTYVTIGGWNPFPSKFEVLYHKIYKGNESDSLYQIRDIIRLFNECGCRLIAADWGCGHVQNLSLIEALGEDRVMQVWHTGMQTKAGGRQRAKWEPKTRKWHLARTAVLTDTFETIKRGQMTFPRAEDCKTMFDHILAESMEYKPETNTTKYVNVEPDDALHSLTYAMLGGEMLMTGDFRGHAGSAEVLPQTVGAPDLQDGWQVSDDYYG
jgi:hypothetical protein